MPIPPLPPIDDVVAAALAEDFGVPVGRLAGEDFALLSRDVTSAVVVPADARFTGVIAARGDAVVCGLPVVARVFELLAAAVGSPDDVEVLPLVAEGTRVAAGAPVMEVSGSARIVLAAERTALDFLMVLSGIASEASRWQTEAGERLRVFDTRKTLPGLRVLSKYAVAVGGAHNHRAGLWDMVLVKDNHLAYAGGVCAALASARASAPGLRVEIEADTLEQALEAARAGADVVMLDNFDDAALTAAVEAIRATGAPCEIEASGGIRFERLRALGATGVDIVSSSAIALAPPADFGLDELSA
ncbi:MAG: carboxylating nicotinate-nucleotide diphosphorylase [Actinomycetota bacterium]|nr:carboxylating nicotinate-nucleotide diphosphorylase [Actinomycetota bacterium]MDP3630033.1 carboxylating nicotinate-nucleotide diphosphorylase [Actinomycetota bacterium]